MAVKINSVESGSVSEKKGVHPGDLLLSVNGNEICDVLDYRFYCDEKKLKIEYENAAGKKKRFTVRDADGPDALGLGFETYLMDRHRSCKNHCIFCFIDQLPPGLRSSLYFKDDDDRLSFLFGNYITLTNLTEHDVERIIRMHISPVNVSVHTMNPTLRVRMMKNPKAGESLALLRRFSDAGIALNAQLVLCAGINDGEELSFSMRELGMLPGVKSVAVVPVGLTKFRDGLFPLEKFTPARAADVIDRIDAFNAGLQAQGREKLVFPSDEFFQIAGRKIPPCDYYGDFPQLENGVGGCALTEHDFMSALEDAARDTIVRRFAIVTGLAAYPLLKKLCDAFCAAFPQTEIEIYGLENRFFGPDITVAGLLTGRDIAAQLKERQFCCKTLLLPQVMFKSRSETVFLDDYTKDELERELGTAITVIDCDGTGMFEAFWNVR